MSSSNSLDFNTSGLEKIQYRTTSTDENGSSETKILTFYYEEEIKDKVPTKDMLDASWRLVEDQEEKALTKTSFGNKNARNLNFNASQSQEQAKFAFQSPVPTISKFSVSSDNMPPPCKLVAKSA